MRHILSASALAAAALVASAPASAAITFSFTATDTHIAQGGSTTITATIAGLQNGIDEIVSAYDLNFIYNGGILNWNVITAHGVLGNSIGVATNGLPEGNLGFNNSSVDSDSDLAALQGDSLLMFTFLMKGAMVDGSTQFTLGPDPDFDRNFTGRDFLTLDVNVGSICIDVGNSTQCGGGGGGNAPEPGTYGLAALGLIAAGVATRRRRRESAEV